MLFLYSEYRLIMLVFIIFNVVVYLNNFKAYRLTTNFSNPPIINRIIILGLWKFPPEAFRWRRGGGNSHNHRHCGDFPRLDPRTSFPFPTFEANTRDISSFPHFLLSDFHEFLSNEISKEISNCLFAFLMRVFLNLSFSSGQITFYCRRRSLRDLWGDSQWQSDSYSYSNSHSHIHHSSIVRYE